MSLSHMFKVRLCNFKATGIVSRGQPPFCVRGNFDGKPFNTEYFNSASMTPMWALDTRFDFHTPNLDVLSNKYLLLEAYGADLFLGMCRIDLYSLATGPTAVELTLREGHRVAGTLTFEAHFEHVTNATLQLTNVSLQQLSTRGNGEDANPSPYIALGFLETGTTVESMVAPAATAPSWDRLPPLHKRCSYQELCDTRICFEIKHARNGYSPGVSDPLLATFELNLSTVPIDVGPDSFIPIRVMVHSTPQYSFPFSTPFAATLEVRNGPKLVQLRGGLLTDSGVVGGVAPIGMAGLNSTTAIRATSPSRVSAAPPPMRESPRTSPTRHVNTSVPQASPAVPSASVYQNTSAAAASYQPPVNVSAAAAASLRPESIEAADVDMMDEVAGRQSSLLHRVHQRLQDVVRRRGDVTRRLEELSAKERERGDSTQRRKTALESDMRTATVERDRIEEALRQLQTKRQEEARVAAEQAAERERMRRDLEEEQREVDVLQNRVTLLRQEMERHLAEEQERYLLRVREAEEARRRAQHDADEFAMIEARLAEAESRAARQAREYEQRHHSRMVTASSPLRGGR